MTDDRKSGSVLIAGALGLIVTMAPDGKLEHFPVVGYVVVCATLTAMFTTWKVKQGIERRAVTAQPAAA